MFTRSSSTMQVEAFIDFTGGVAGGAASVYIGQPLDTVKVKMQTFPALYKGATDCFKQTLQREGIYRGLYAGTLPSLAAQVSENAVLFLAYGVSQKAVAMYAGKSTNDLGPVHNATAGGFAAFWSSLVLCPTELVKCRLQTSVQASPTATLDIKSAKTPQPITPWQLTRDILRADGVRGLYKGLTATFVREMPGYFFFFGGYELSRQLLTPAGKTKDDLGSLNTMLCGACGGVSFWMAVYPTDVIKSRAHISQQSNTPGFFRMFVDIARHEGLKALYRGLSPTIVRTIPATAGLFLAYESTKAFLSRNLLSSNDSAS